MSKALDFYFDFSSPYSYLASTAIDALAAAHGYGVNWHPILLGVIFKTVGNQQMTEVPLKGRYAWHDLARSARFHGIAFKHPTHFPLGTQIAARAMLWIRQRQGDAAAVRFAQAIFAAMFVDDIDISQKAEVLRIAAALEADAAALETALEAPEIKEQLKTEVAQALQRGVFGAPFIIVGDEAFWGFDRFDQLAAYLKNGNI
ncbi:MAG: 2-hydroxychromene-2-carboxylate isomerase [Herbaspirillum sp.]|nr:2-hydroxychromene-2-carboxylate isomerase [Herbaspirillum sp.]